MAVIDQELTNQYAIYNGDCCEVLPTLPAASIHLSLYSPPFGGLFHYSSSPRDLSNCRSYEEFLQHYEFVVKEIHRLTVPGRVSAVHCADVPLDGANTGGGLADLPGDIIRLHRRLGFDYCARYHVWKEPFGVRLRTMAKGLAHRQAVDDSTLCEVANADYLLMFRKTGENPVPVAHPIGLTSYAGAREVPSDLLRYRGYYGKQTENRYSQWVWRQYASAFWDDVRLDRVLPFKECRDPDDERHVHPLQLDVIERCVTLWTNPGEVVLSPFMGVGSEVFGAVTAGRKALGIELKSAYFKQAKLNLRSGSEREQRSLFDAEYQDGEVA